jgi:hypothetical protein
LNFAGKPVRVLGINVFEGDASGTPDEDPASVFKKAGCTYDSLPHGDSVALLYHVTAIPVIYVIDSDGRVLVAEEGFKQAADERLGECIDAALGGR